MRIDKQHILDEIRRTAAANGGKPLGIARFAQETGIRIDDWRGKVWVKWSDALHEAGFEPNRLQTAYDDDLLVEKLVALARELGHFPTRSEMKMKAHNDKTFPNPATFSRLGSRSERAARMSDYCKRGGGFDDVVEMCTTIPERRSLVSPRGIEPGQCIGFVYLIKSGRYYKIGRSNAVGRRERELAIQLPERASTAHTIRTDDPVGIEAYWHNRFKDRHKNGEWFDLSQSDVNAFKRRKFM